MWDLRGSVRSRTYALIAVTACAVAAPLCAFAAPKPVFKSDLQRTTFSCSGILPATDTSAVSVHREIVPQVLRCLMQQRDPVLLAQQAFELTRACVYELPSEFGDFKQPLSKLSDNQLRAVLNWNARPEIVPLTFRGNLDTTTLLFCLSDEVARWKNLALGSNGKRKPLVFSDSGRHIRRGIDKETLDELAALGAREERALTNFTIQVIQAVQAHRRSFEVELEATKPAKAEDRPPLSQLRVRMLLHLANNVTLNLHPDGGVVLDQVLAVNPEFEMGLSEILRKFEPHSLLLENFAELVSSGQLAYWTAWSALQGDPTKPMDELKDDDLPSAWAARSLGKLRGDSGYVDVVRNHYLQILAVDQKQSKEMQKLLTRLSLARSGGDPVRVAFLDSGVDPLTYPDLAPHLSDGGDDRVMSFDFADGDSIPFAPALRDDREYRMLGHGTGAISSFLTTLNRAAPQALAPKRIDLGVWKVATSRQVLAGEGGPWVSWAPAFTPFEAILRTVDRSVPGIQPRIVSVSYYFQTKPYLNIYSRPRLIAEAPWLWVMSAGNEGRDVAAYPDSDGNPDLRPSGGESRDGPSCFMDVPTQDRDDSKILCVGALARGITSDSIAKYSNYGARVDVYTYADQNRLCPAWTSCAAPAMSAVAAAVLDAVPKLTSTELKRAIMDGADMQRLPVSPELSEQGIDLRIKDESAERIKPIYRWVRVFDPQKHLARTIALAKTMVKRKKVPVEGVAPLWRSDAPTTEKENQDPKEDQLIPKFPQAPQLFPTDYPEDSDRQLPWGKSRRFLPPFQ